MTGTPDPAVVSDLNNFSDSADWEWNLEDEAAGTDFEIDADATSYYMPVGNVVTFKAKALNGTPPFTYSWDFADGTVATGEMVKHVFAKPAAFEVKVTGTDASGAKSDMLLGMLVATPLEFAIRMQKSPEEIEALRALYPESPSPSVTP